MLALEWNETGRRFYETGIDRGVLYPSVGDGVPWNGLTSVEESVSGGELSSYYYDGTKYLDIIASEDFEGTLEAYTYPPEFEEFDGNLSLAPGLFATRQPRKSFGLCYRSLIGSDKNRAGKDYKIHIIYNAIAQPAAKTRKTISENIDPETFQWAISAVPPAAAAAIYKPTSHFIVDSRALLPERLDLLESYLYGHIPDNLMIDGGTPSFTSPGILDGGSPNFSSFGTIDGGHPWTEGTVTPQLPPQSYIIAFLT